MPLGPTHTNEMSLRSSTVSPEREILSWRRRLWPRRSAAASARTPRLCCRCRWLPGSGRAHQGGEPRLELRARWRVARRPLKITTTDSRACARRPSCDRGLNDLRLLRRCVLGRPPSARRPRRFARRPGSGRASLLDAKPRMTAHLLDGHALRRVFAKHPREEVAAVVREAVGELQLCARDVALELGDALAPKGELSAGPLAVDEQRVQ